MVKPDETTCPACAETIKAAAIKCKHCGHEISQAEMAARAKKAAEDTKGGAIGCVILLVGALLLISMCSGGEGSEGTKVADAKDKQAGFHCLSGWDGSHREFVESVKAGLRDPSSFEHIETRVTPNVDGQHTIFMDYRARNGFGGMNVGRAVGTFDNASCAASAPIMAE